MVWEYTLSSHVHELHNLATFSHTHNLHVHNVQIVRKNENVPYFSIVAVQSLHNSQSGHDS